MRCVTHLLFFFQYVVRKYESPDVTAYPRKVNHVPSSYIIGKLCTEDPISVSLKHHPFFNTVIVKGAVLGTVDHFYWKKEYQAHVAPHYRILLWV